MKHLTLITLLAAMVLSAPIAVGQNQKQSEKAAKAAMRAKPDKLAKDEAKKLTKEGWKVTPGALPLERQLDRAYIMQYEIDDEGYPKYIIGEAMSVGQIYDAAKTQALDIAKLNLAGQIQSEISSLIETAVSNSQISSKDAASVAETITASKTLIVQSIGRHIPMVEVYRDLKNGNKEVMIRIGYDKNAAQKNAVNILKEELKKKGDVAHERLDEILK